MKVIKVKINGFFDREKITSTLARNGIKTWEEIEEDSLHRREYFVCFERNE